MATPNTGSTSIKCLVYGWVASSVVNEVYRLLSSLSLLCTVSSSSKHEVIILEAAHLLIFKVLMTKINAMIQSACTHK